MSDLISVEEFRRLAKRKLAGGKAVYRVSTDNPLAIPQTRKVRFCFSDGSVDRMGDTIDPDGWQLDDFLRNPVALFAHDASQPPIGRASNLAIEDGRLMGDIEFASLDVYPFADTIYKLVVAGFMSAVSVGFIPEEYEWSNDDARKYGIDFRRQSLLEISVVPVPANANALLDAADKGIDVGPVMRWAEAALAGGGLVGIPKGELEALRMTAEKAMSPRPPRVSKQPSGMGETDPSAGGGIIGNCGRGVGDECGMKDPAECSVHCSGDDMADDLKAFRKMIAEECAKAVKAALAPGVVTKAEVDPEDEPVLEHEDAVRLAHKSLGTGHAYIREAVSHFRKALDTLQPVVDALDAASGDGEGDGDGDEDGKKPSDGDGDEGKSEDPDDTEEKLIALYQRIKSKTGA